MFRRKQTDPTPAAPAQPEAIAISVDELAALEKVLLEADRLRRVWRESPLDFGFSADLLTVHEVTAMLYQRAGAASAVQPDRQLARLPLYCHEIKWLADAIWMLERYRASDSLISDARQLHNRFNALLGQARAITHMGGTAVFTPESPQVPEVRVIPPH